MRELGIYAWFGYDLPLSERLEMIAAAGFASTCLWLGPVEAMVAASQADRMPELAQRCGLRIDNVHAEYLGCNSLWTDADNDDVFGSYSTAIDFCRRHGIPILVAHVTQGLNPPPAGEAGLDRLRRLVDQAGEQGVVLAIENTNRPDYVDFLLSRCDLPSLGLCYDSSHDFLKGTPPLSILKRWGHRLVTVHLSDNHGQRDDHTLPGDGIVDWQALIACFPADSYRGPVMLEVVPDPQARLDAREFLTDAHARAAGIREQLSPTKPETNA